MAACHFPFRTPASGATSSTPTGSAGATPYWREGVVTADVDLDAGQIWFAPSQKPSRAVQKGYLSGYHPQTIPEQRTDLRRVLLEGPRPELYRAIVEKTLAGRDFSDEIKNCMGWSR